MSIPQCPRSLRAHWITDEHGELVLSCTPTTPEDLEKDASDKKVLCTILFIALFIYLLLICLIAIAKKREFNRVGKQKKVATAYPYTLFPPRNV